MPKVTLRNIDFYHFNKFSVISFSLMKFRKKWPIMISLKKCNVFVNCYFKILIKF